MSKFVLNTTNLHTAASMVCISGLAQLLKDNGHEAIINDWEHYENYDYAIFMAYDPDIERAREANPNLKIGLADPKPSSVLDAKKADFLLVSSIEQRELFYAWNPNIFIYYMIPEFDAFEVKHKKKERIVIGYHGNKVHLNTFYRHITPALEKLGERFDIELHAIYNIEKFGRWTIGRPNEQKCPVIDLQWYENCYKDYFNDIDIGIVPNIYPNFYEMLIKRFLTTSKYFFLETLSDHLIKYKFSANAGRIFIFGQFAIPVVSEAIPSAGEVIRDGYSGRLVLDSYGWYYALEGLILSEKMRRNYGGALKAEVGGYFSRDGTFKRFMIFLETIRKVETPRFIVRRPVFLKYMMLDIIRRLQN